MATLLLSRRNTGPLTTLGPLGQLGPPGSQGGPQDGGGRRNELSKTKYVTSPKAILLNSHTKFETIKEFLYRRKLHTVCFK